MLKKQSNGNNKSVLQLINRLKIGHRYTMDTIKQLSGIGSSYVTVDVNENH